MKEYDNIKKTKFNSELISHMEVIPSNTAKKEIIKTTI